MPRRLALALSLISAFSAGAAAQERQWSLDAGDENAYLVFGVPESDDVGFSMWCANRSGEINIFVPESDPGLEPGKTVTFKMTAGEEKALIVGKASANEESGTISLEASIADSNPIFAGLLTADRFRVKLGEEEQIFPLMDADVAGLLALCRKP